MAGGFQPPVYAAPLGAPFSERSLGKSLEGYLGSHLDDSPILSTTDLAKGRRTQCSVGIGEIGVVEQIEELTTDFEG